jgi:hypothetical protein
MQLLNKGLITILGKNIIFREHVCEWIIKLFPSEIKFFSSEIKLFTVMAGSADSICGLCGAT